MAEEALEYLENVTEDAEEAEKTEKQLEEAATSETTKEEGAKETEEEAEHTVPYSRFKEIYGALKRTEREVEQLSNQRELLSGRLQRL